MLLLVFCGVIAFGQNATATLVGLPEFGVTLAGDVSNPTIVNTSGRTILGHVILFRDDKGGGRLVRTMDTRRLRLGLPLNARLDGPMPAQISNRGVMVQALLDAISFDNGQFVGPEHGHSFDMLAARIDAERTLAQHVAARNGAIWVQLIIFVATRGKTHSLIEDVAQKEQLVLAGDLLGVRIKKGEAAAFEIAERASSLPKLWRAPQSKSLPIELLIR